MEERTMERMKMSVVSVERAIEVLDRDETFASPREIREACYIGREALLLVLECGMAADRIRELAMADREGRVIIKPPITGAVCGTCANFCRTTGTRRGTCKVKPYKRDRGGRVHEGTQFVVSQSHLACKMYEKRK